MSFIDCDLSATKRTTDKLAQVLWQEDLQNITENIVAPLTNHIRGLKQSKFQPCTRTMAVVDLAFVIDAAWNYYLGHLHHVKRAETYISEVE